MIYLQFDENGKLKNHYNRPFDNKYGLGKTQEQLLQEGILVESIPQPIEQEGKVAILSYNEIDGLHYKYEDIPPSKEDLQAQEIVSLEQQLKLVNSDLQGFMDLYFSQL